MTTDIEIPTAVESYFDELVLRFDETEPDGRTLTGYAVPWNQPALVARPVRGYELYRRGALTRSYREGHLSGKQPIVLLGMHRETDPVGKLVHTSDDEYGQQVIFRMFQSQAAKDATEMIHEGIWRGLSIGGTAVPARTKVSRRPDGEVLIERSEIIWDHVGLVRKPAFVGAGVTVLREEQPVDLASVVEQRRKRRERLLA
jgi:HK97 family phage prohead protease